MRLLHAVLLVSLSVPGLAGVGEINPDGVPAVAKLLADVIRINASNPPGKEGKMAEFLKTKFATLGFEIDIIPTPQAGKAHFVARLRGDGSKRPVLVAPSTILR